MLRLGDSLDMRCANLSLAYEGYLNKQSKLDKGQNLSEVDHDFTEDELKAMVANVNGASK